jgi:hypothetical protein
VSGSRHLFPAYVYIEKIGKMLLLVNGLAKTVKIPMLVLYLLQE